VTMSRPKRTGRRAAAGGQMSREFGGFVVTVERQGRRWRVEVFNGEQTFAKVVANLLGRTAVSFLREAGLSRSDVAEYRRWIKSLAEPSKAEELENRSRRSKSARRKKSAEGAVQQQAAAAPAGQGAEPSAAEPPKVEEAPTFAGAAGESAPGGAEVPLAAEASGEPAAEEPPQRSEEPSLKAVPESPALQQAETMTWMSEAAGAGEEAGAVPDEPQRGRPAEAEKPPEAAAPSQPEAGGTAEAAEPQIGEAEGAEGPPAVADGAEERPSAPTAGQAAEPPEAPPAPAEARPAAVEQSVECLKQTYGRCSPFGITELLVERAKREPAGVRLALVQIWRTVLAGLGADPRQYEPMWIDAGLDPQAVITPEDRARAEAAAEEALEGCKLCAVDLGTFLRLVKHVTLAERPDGDTILVVEVAYGGAEATVATKTSQWIKERKDEVKYAIPLVLRERLRQLGLMLDIDAFELYVELTRRAERYQQVADAYLRPILLHAIEALRASPYQVKCSRDRRVIYIATDLFKTALWYFNSHVELGKKRLYAAFRRHGLLAYPDSVAVTLIDEYGEKVRKRALAFFAERLAEFIEADVQSLCKRAAMAEEEEGEPQNAPPKAGP